MGVLSRAERPMAPHTRMASGSSRIPVGEVLNCSACDPDARCIPAFTASCLDRHFCLQLSFMHCSGLFHVLCVREMCIWSQPRPSPLF